MTGHGMDLGSRNSEAASSHLIFTSMFQVNFRHVENVYTKCTTLHLVQKEKQTNKKDNLSFSANSSPDFLRFIQRLKSELKESLV